jgi:hypothetical protein
MGARARPSATRETRGVDLAHVLAEDYGIIASSIEPRPGGWEADCFVADGVWFIKVWRRDPPTTLALLNDLAERGLPVVPPIHTIDGRLATTTCGVFPYTHGSPAADDPVQLARVLRQVHAITDVELEHTTMDEWSIEFLRAHLDHPWIVDRRDELAAAVDRLEAVIDLARQTEVPHVLVHNDLYGDNLLVDDNGDVVAILDWDHACLAPREHDLWTLADVQRPERLLDAYGAGDLDPTHLEYAVLARGLRDLAARVQAEADRPGVDEWGFRRIARIDELLADQ